MNEYQRAVFDIERMYTGTAVGCIGGMMRFKEGIDPERVSDAAERFIKETPAIRNELTAAGELYISDRISRPASETLNGELYEYANRFMSKPFELYNSPLYEFRYLHTSEGDVMLFKLHHILGDYMALMNMIQRLEKLYMSSDIPASNDGGIAPQYPAQAVEYYKERFGAGVPAPFFGMPKSIRSGTVKRELGIGGELIDHCLKNSLRLEAVISAAIALYFKKTKGTEKIVIGNTVMNRDRHSLYSFGMYANTLPMIIGTDGDFVSLCRKANEEALAAQKYGAYPYRRMLADNGMGGRCFDIAVTSMSVGMLPRFLTGVTEKLTSGFSELPLRIYIIRQKHTVTLEAEYNLGLFSEEYINGFISSIEHMIDSGINGGEITAATREDEAAYARLNDVPYKPSDTTVTREFIGYAAAHPDDIAYISDGEAVTFNEAYKMARCIAAEVEGCKVAALACGRCRYLIPAMLGVMMSGAAYMPVTPGLKIPDCCDRTLSLSAYGIEGAIALDRIEYSETGFDDRSLPDGIAYYMNTSGSTGAPKTVMIKNSSLWLRLLWMHEKYGLNRRILQKTSITFDVSGWELLCCAFGGTAVMMADGGEAAPERLAEYIKKYDIELIHFVPTVLRLFCKSGRAEDCVSIRDIISSGEALGAADMRLVKAAMPGAKLHDLYGPTECTIDVSYYDCIGDETEIPIGEPVYNTGLYVVNDWDELMPRGVAGELMVTGGLVGAGCLGGGGGYTKYRGMDAYRTGDICRLGFDDKIYYIDRADRQVKINGMRVELDGIERMSRSIDGVDQAAAVVDGGLVYLFCSGTRGAEEIRAELSDLTDRLPSYIYTVETMPVTSSGKLDRTALISVLERKTEPPLTEAERDIYREVLAELNAGGTVRKELDVNEDIFSAGLSSLSVLMLEQRLKNIGYGLTARDLYIKRSVRALAGGAAGVKGGVVYLKRAESRRVLCCFTYAGGAPQSFSRVAADFDGDVIGIDYSWFDVGADVGTIAESTAEFLSEYDEIYIAAHCIGSVFAVETAYLLETGGRKVSKVYIIGSLPPTASPINPWRRLPKAAVIGIVSRLGGKKLPRNFPIDRFLCDTDRYFKYNKKHIVNAQAFIAYASGDGFTKGFKKKKWDGYFKTTPKVSVFESDSHYFFENTEDLLKKTEGGYGRNN